MKNIFIYANLIDLTTIKDMKNIINKIKNIFHMYIKDI